MDKAEEEHERTPAHSVVSSSISFEDVELYMFDKTFWTNNLIDVCSLSIDRIESGFEMDFISVDTSLKFWLPGNPFLSPNAGQECSTIIICYASNRLSK